MLKLIAPVLAGLLLIAALAAVWPRDDSPQAQYERAARFARQEAEATEAAARWACFWGLVTPAAALSVAGLLLLAPTAGMLALLRAADAYLLARQPLVAIAGVPVARYQVVDGQAWPLQAAAVQGRLAADLAAAQRPIAVPHTLTTHYAPPAGTAPSPGADEPPVADLPGPCTFGELGFTPTPGGILTGIAAGHRLLTAPFGDELCHILIYGMTGGGKSALYRSMITQIIAAGGETFLMDQHYAPVDRKTGDEWWPLALRSTPGHALAEPAAIIAALDEALQVLDRRLTDRRQDRDWGAPRFYAIEEAPALRLYDPQIMFKLRRLLLEGRKVDLFVIFSSQSAMVKVLGGSTNETNQFGTIAYVGGDPIATQRLLGVKDEPAGKGIIYLKCHGQRTPALTREPLMTNADVHALLGTRPDMWPRTSFTSSSPVRDQFVTPPSPLTGELVNELVIVYKDKPLELDFIAAVQALFERGLSSTEITKELNNGKTGGDMAVKVGLVYQALVARLRAELAGYRHEQEG